jgi:two-component system sensor histidine kinase/response regulator
MVEAQKFVLVVEDDDTLRLLATKQLSRLGFIGHSVPDGLEAVERSKEHSYCLILMDVQMPRMNGLEATTAIRRLENAKQHRRVPIVAMTANPDRDQCIKAGMDDFIFKPVLLAHLRELLDRWVPQTAVSA